MALDGRDHAPDRHRRRDRGVDGCRARRSDTALRRFNDSARSANLEIEVGLPTEAQLHAFEAAMGSAPVGRIHVFGVSPANRPSVAMGANVDDSFGTAVDRSRVMEGRQADPEAVDEVTISESLAQQTLGSP